MYYEVWHRLSDTVSCFKTLYEVCRVDYRKLFCIQFYTRQCFIPLRELLLKQ